MTGGAGAAAPFFILVAALFVDALVGDMPWLFRRVPHPVVLVGRLIGALDRRLNRPERSERDRLLRGGFATALVTALAASAGWAVALASSTLPHGWTLEVAALAVLLAQRSLYDHGRAVARGLRSDGLAGGRSAVRHIVGRDVEALDRHGVSRAAIESLAENFSDGVAAPAFWYLVGGLPALFAYKAVNTLDSMIGHRSPRYRSFGKVAARVDDIANLIPARLSGLLIVLAATVTPTARPTAAITEMFRYAPRHESPNAGWPEAAMAGALGVALGGPRRYPGGVTKGAWIGGGRARADVADIERALVLYGLTGVILAVLAAAGGLAFAR